MAKRSFYTQIGITKKDLNSMASFITFLIIIPIFFINSVGKIITFFLMKYNNNGKQKSKKIVRNSNYVNIIKVKK